VLAHRLKAQGEAALELEQLAFVLKRRPGHQHIDDVDVLAHAGDRGLKLDPVKMFGHVGAGGAQSDDHAAFAQRVQRTEMLRVGAWRARIDIHNEGADLNPLGVLGDQGQ